MSVEEETRDTMKLLIKIVIIFITFIVIVFGSCAVLIFNADAQQDALLLEKLDKEDFKEAQAKLDIRFKDYSGEHSKAHGKIEKKIDDLNTKFENKLDASNEKIDTLNGNVIKILTIMEEDKG